jgi:hypothetical protein
MTIRVLSTESFLVWGASRPGPSAACWGREDFERLANSGGPMSRGRRERLTATVLGQDDGAVRCPRVLRIGLDFGRRNPLSCVRGLLKTCGFADEREAHAALALPAEPCICRPDAAPHPSPVMSLPAEDALYQALVLGLCTAWCYDPRRPVLWTRASLTRQLELFDGRGFYA